MPSSKKLGYFDGIIDDAIKNGIVPDKIHNSMLWYRQQVRKVGMTTQPRYFTENKDRRKFRPEYGKMYHFFYRPKGAETLPYYDRFPLVFMIRSKPGGFIGLNLHYLNHWNRAIFMRNLYNFASDRNYDHNTRLLITYKTLLRAGRYKYFYPCIKRYNFTQVKSGFIEINPLEWNIVLFLPTERFEKSEKKYVWRETSEIIESL